MGKKLEKYSICSPNKHIKQSWVAGMFEPNILAPIVYLQRPKWIDDNEKWNEIVKSIRLDLPQGFEI